MTDRVTSPDATGTEVRRFPIRLGRKSRPVLLLFGVRAGNAYVDLSSDTLEARFGFFRVIVPLSNIARYSIEGPWLWLTAIGVRGSVRHGDITFGGNHRGGVRIDFKERQRFLVFHPPALYVTVADLEGLAQGLAARGIPGRDLRRTQ